MCLHEYNLWLCLSEYESTSRLFLEISKPVIPTAQNTKLMCFALSLMHPMMRRVAKIMYWTSAHSFSFPHRCAYYVYRTYSWTHIGTRIRSMLRNTWQNWLIQAISTILIAGGLIPDQQLRSRKMFQFTPPLECHKYNIFLLTE